MVDAYAAEHLEIQTRDAPRVAVRVRNAGAIFVGPCVAGVARRLLRRLQPRAAHRRLRPALRPACPCRRSCAASTSSSTTRRRCARWPATWWRWPAPRTCPRTARPVGHAPGPPTGRRLTTDSTTCRSATTCAAGRRTARRSSTSPVRLNTNENSLPAAGAGGRRRSRRRSRAAAAGPQPLPGPGRASALRADLAAYLGHGLTAANVWAANGSNEVQQQLLQAFGGPGRTALGLRPVVLDAPVLSRRHRHRLGRRRRATPTSAVPPRQAVAQVGEHRPDVVFLCSPNNPTGTALPLDVVDAVLDAAPGHGGRRRGVRRVRPARARRARWPCCPATRGWWSPAR